MKRVQKYCIFKGPIEKRKTANTASSTDLLMSSDVARSNCCEKKNSFLEASTLQEESAADLHARFPRV